MTGDTADCFVGVSPVEVTVDIVEEVHLFDAENAGGVMQLTLARFGDDFNRRAVVAFQVAVPAALATRGADNICFDALTGVFGEASAEPERFVIGMSQDSHETQVAHNKYLLIRALPSALPPPWVRGATQRTVQVYNMD
jgi:hypothetical protein